MDSEAKPGQLTWVAILPDCGINEGGDLRVTWENDLIMNHWLQEAQAEEFPTWIEFHRCDF